MKSGMYSAKTIEDRELPFGAGVLPAGSSVTFVLSEPYQRYYIQSWTENNAEFEATITDFKDIVLTKDFENLGGAPASWP